MAHSLIDNWKPLRGEITVHRNRFFFLAKHFNGKNSVCFTISITLKMAWNSWKIRINSTKIKEINSTLFLVINIKSNWIKSIVEKWVIYHGHQHQHHYRRQLSIYWIDWFVSVWFGLACYTKTQPINLTKWAEKVKKTIFLNDTMHRVRWRTLSLKKIAIKI